MNKLNKTRSRQVFVQKFKNNWRRGFTLIELLVVLAIIGILSAVVLIATATPRNNGADAAVKANLRTIVEQSYIFFDTYGRYNTGGSGNGGSPPVPCPTSGNGTSMFAQDPVISRAISAANSAGGGTASCWIGTNGATFIVWAPLKSGGFWCIDQTNSGKFEASGQGNLDTVTCK